MREGVVHPASTSIDDPRLLDALLIYVTTEVNACLIEGKLSWLKTTRSELPVEGHLIPLHLEGDLASEAIDSVRVLKALIIIEVDNAWDVLRILDRNALE